MKKLVARIFWAVAEGIVSGILWAAVLIIGAKQKAERLFRYWAKPDIKTLPISRPPHAVGRVEAGPAAGVRKGTRRTDGTI